MPELGHTQKHGLYSKRPIIRALLSEEEAEAWDSAPIPADCPEALEEIFREFFVMKFRVHRWEKDSKAPGPSDVAALNARLRLLYLPLRGLLKTVEVHARIKEADQTGDMSDAVLAYLRTLPTHQLEVYLLEGEAPRFDPGTGQPLVEIPRETPWESLPMLEIPTDGEDQSDA